MTPAQKAAEQFCKEVLNLAEKDTPTERRLKAIIESCLAEQREGQASSKAANTDLGEVAENEGSTPSLSNQPSAEEWTVKEQGGEVFLVRPNHVRGSIRLPLHYKTQLELIANARNTAAQQAVDDFARYHHGPIVADLNKRLAEAKKDTERLDWLEHSFQVNVKIEGLRQEEAGTLREAIDAARAAQNLRP